MRYTLELGLILLDVRLEDEDTGKGRFKDGYWISDLSKWIAMKKKENSRETADQREKNVGNWNPGMLTD